MRAFGLFVLILAACDLQPPRRDAAGGSGQPAAKTAPAPLPSPGSGAAVRPPAPPPAPPPTPPPPVVDAGVEPVTDGSAAAPADTKDDCTAVAVHVTERLIANATPENRALMEQERTRTVRTLVRECTRQKWSDEIRKCFLGTQTNADIEVCSKKVAPAAPPAKAPAPPANEPGPRKQPAPKGGAKAPVKEPAPVHRD